MKKTLLSAASIMMAASSAQAVTLVWDFEGGGTGTLGDTSGTVFFSSDVDPVANDTAWAVGSTGITQAIAYGGLTQINGEHNNRAAGNDWFLRSDHAQNGGVLTKPGDSRTGTIVSDSFTIDGTSSFSFYLGGGITGGSFVLRDASDDSVILSADPLANGHIYRTGGTSQASDGLREWTSGDLTGAGVTGPTDVYLSIEDDSTGGWGHLQVDDITVNNATVIPEPTAGLLGLLGLGVVMVRRRR